MIAQRVIVVTRRATIEWRVVGNVWYNAEDGEVDRLMQRTDFPHGEAVTHAAGLALAMASMLAWHAPDIAEAAASKGTSRQLESGETNQSGPVTISPISGRRQMASLGSPFAAGNFTTGRFQLRSGLFAATATSTKGKKPVSDLDMTVVRVKTDAMGVEITPVTWQKDADPFYLWDAPAKGLEIAGYSYALDAEPDDIVDTTSLSWDVAADPIKRLAEGKRTFSVKAVNSAGNSGRSASIEIWIDTVAPVISGYSPSPGTLVNNLKLPIAASIEESGSGVTAQTVQVLVNGSVANATVDQANKTVTASGAGLMREGANAFEIRATDQVGNAATPVVWSVTADVTPPSGSVLINAGSTMSTTVYVTLNLTATDATSGVARMLLSNDPVVGYVDEPFAATRQLWRLNAVRGPQRVYVKFVDKAGNTSAPVFDEIDLGLLAPDTLITSGPAGITPQRGATFTYSCPEGGCVFSYAFDSESWSEWSEESTVTRAELPFGNHYFKVKAAKETNGQNGIQPDEEDPTPSERTWIIGVESTNRLIPRGNPIKLWRLE